DHARRFPLDAGLPIEAARQSLALPAAGLVEALLTDRAATRVVAESGRLLPAERAGRVPAAVQPALDELGRRWADDPVAARAAAALAGVPAPFTVSRARRQWQTSRRVAVPLLEALAARGLTAVDDEGRHRLVRSGRSADHSKRK